MDIFQKIEQGNFFDNKNNRYDQINIGNPPIHTDLELKILLSKIAKKSNISKVADFGCGNGRLTVPLLRMKKNLHVIAIDVSKRSLKELKGYCIKEGLPNIKTALNFKGTGRLDAIVGTDVLHHVDMEHFFALFHKKLSVGGKLVFSEPGAWNISWYIYLPVFRSWKIEKGIVDCSYFNIYKLLKKNGFVNIKITGLGFLPRPIFNWSKTLCVLNDKIGNHSLLKLFAYRYIIEAEKK